MQWFQAVRRAFARPQIASMLNIYNKQFGVGQAPSLACSTA
jgi:hypothetical protein